MEDMRNIQAIDSLDDMTGIIKNELENIAEGFISVGYYLKKTMDDQLYRQKGYENLYEYAKDVFGIGRTTAIRFMEINEKYSIGGYSPQIEDKWKGYGSSKLTEMLGLPEEIREAVPVEATVRDIREAKGIVRVTESHYSDQMELCDIAQEPEESKDWLELLVKEVFKENKEAFRKMVDWERKDIGCDEREIEEDVLAIVNPTKFKMIRLERANVLLQEKCIRVMPYRDQGQQEEYTYIDFAKTFEEVFYPNYPDISAPIQQVYEQVYGVAMEEVKKEKTEKTIPKEEKKEIKADKAPEKSKEPQEKEIPVKTKEAIEEEPVKAEDEQIPGQTELTKDFPQYCPPQEVKTFYKTRKEHLEGLDGREAGEYMARVMENTIKKLHNTSMQVLTQGTFWTGLLTKEVDEKGEEIIEVDTK